MHDLVSVRTAAKALGMEPMKLGRWLQAVPSIQVHKISTRAYAVSFTEVTREIANATQAGTLPLRRGKRGKRA